MSSQPAVSREVAAAAHADGGPPPAGASPVAREGTDAEPSPSGARSGASRPADTAPGRPGLDTTAVLPYAGSQASRRTRRLRAWMITGPADLAGLLAPLLLTTRFWRGTLVMAALTVTVFAVGGLYRARRHTSLLDELPSLTGRLLACGAVVAIIAAIRHDSADDAAGFMRGVGVSAGLVIVSRAVTRSLAGMARRRRWVEHNAIVIGSGPVAAELARMLRRYPRYGLRFVGCVDAAGAHAPGRLPVIGTLDDLERMVELVECEVLIIADPSCPEPALMELLRRPASSGCDLWAVPRLWGSRTHDGNPDHIGAIPIVKVGDTTFSGPRWAVKRASDVVIASVALVALSPVLLLCALATYLEDRRGIFFLQERVGRHGRLFRVVKFRSMRPVDEHESRTNWSIAHDRRVGPVGRFLRRTSLDELPQLWNILRGDMSVVGPRPERPHFVEQFSAQYPQYAMRHRVPVGLTGLAQVSGLRGDTPISDRARFDNYYIENWSLWLDVKVILRTVAEVFRGGRH
ncbi:sugar transferase [Micromonospora sp. NPDC020750]|uniref:sugar transferase n=1 Tax=unclassified Micromonospora TaxID=2617518 RepID=UPI0037AC2038